MRGRRVSFVLLGVALSTLLVASPASADVATSPPWPEVVNWENLASTGWSQGPQFDLAPGQYSTQLGRAAVWLAEPYQVGGLVKQSWGVKYSAGAITMQLIWYVLCQNTTTGALTEVLANQSSTSRASNATDSPSMVASNWSNTATGTGSCSSGRVPYGSVVTLATNEYDAGTLVIRNRAVWFNDAVHPPVSGPPIGYCRTLFGPNYEPTTTATVNGAEVTAASVGCMGDYLTDPGDPVADSAEAASVDFSILCADAPVATWTTFDWLPDWVGHYAACLTDPTGWDPGDRIDTAYSASPVSAVTTAVSGLNSVQLSGSCGVLSSGVIRGEPIAVDTCEWTNFAGAKTVVGLGFLLFAGFCVLSMLISALGLNFDAPWLNRTLYTGD